MGDRGVIQFTERGEVLAAIYSHWRGSELGKVWDEFVRWQTRCISEQEDAYRATRTGATFTPDPDYPPMDPRWADAPYLAMRFAGWVTASKSNQAGQYSGLGWGIVPANWTDGALWRVACDTRTAPPRAEAVH